jgi:hypothetical protein
VTGGGEPPLPFNVDETGAAGSEWRAVWILAQLRQSDAETVHGVQHRGALGELYGRLVNRDV